MTLRYRHTWFGLPLHLGILPGGVWRYDSVHMNSKSPIVGLIMGSKSDWETLQHADQILTRFNIAHECKVVSAHRTPQLMVKFATQAQARGLKVIIAGAGGAAHLPGMVAANTLLPVIGVPVQSAALNGMDSLLSIVQMPAGVPVATMAIGRAGAVNAALLAVAILANHDEGLNQQLKDYRLENERMAQDSTLP